MNQIVYLTSSQNYSYAASSAYMAILFHVYLLIALHIVLSSYNLI